MIDTNRKHFLRQRREDLGLSQGDLALRLDARGVHLSRKVISDWERGKRRLDLEPPALEALADALRWNADQLAKMIAVSTQSNHP